MPTLWMKKLRLRRIFVLCRFGWELRFQSTLQGCPPESPTRFPEATPTPPPAPLSDSTDRSWPHLGASAGGSGHQPWAVWGAGPEGCPGTEGGDIMVSGTPTIPTLSQTFPASLCWSVLPRDPAELAAHAQVATWEWASPQPTMAGRVGSFSNLRVSLPHKTLVL